jgi:hypothetical protein
MPQLNSKDRNASRAESIVTLVNREGIGRVLGGPDNGDPYWYECLRCWKRHDKYQDLRTHAREEHGWTR